MSDKKEQMKRVMARIFDSFPALLAKRVLLAKEIVENDISEENMDSYIKEKMLVHLKNVKITTDQPAKKALFANYCPEKKAVAASLVFANDEHVIIGQYLPMYMKNYHNYAMQMDINGLEEMKNELISLRGVLKNNVQITNLRVINNVANAYFQTFDKVAIAVDMVRETPENLELAKFIASKIDSEDIKSLEDVYTLKYNDQTKTVKDVIRGKIKKVVVLTNDGGWIDNVR